MECIVHKDELIRPWLNRLGNDVFFTWVTQNGYIESFMIDPGSNGLVNPQTTSGHFYLRDNTSGNFSLLNETSKEGDWESIIGLGYNSIKKEALGLSTKLTYFVPRDDNLLAILVELTNSTDRTRDLSLFAQVEWNIGDITKKVAHPSDGVGGSQANLCELLTH